MHEPGRNSNNEGDNAQTHLETVTGARYVPARSSCRTHWDTANLLGPYDRTDVLPAETYRAPGFISAAVPEYIGANYGRAGLLLSLFLC